MAESNTPDFYEPPVIETVLGVEYTPLEKWSLPHFGLYWAEIRDKYRQVDVQPPLFSTIERFGDEARKTGPAFQLIGDAASTARCWFIDESERRLIQLQNGRFILNWRKIDDSDEYPHYIPALRGAFEEEWNRFRRFLAKSDLGEPRVVQCEVTYVNNINQGKGWQTFADLPRVIPSWSGRHSGNFLPVEESVALNVRYLMPGNRGRLHVILNRGLRTSDAQETIQLNLTARGAPASSSTDDVLAWLDLGREWVVRGFTDFTSEEMHKQIWRRKQ